MVCGTVAQVVFQNEENGYAVLRLATPDGGEVTATGYIPGLGLGEELSLGGHWTTHPAYGEQFTAETFERHLPVSARGIADYLGSGLIKGVGPKLAAKIAGEFGEETFDILQNDPAQLTAIRGITPKKSAGYWQTVHRNERNAAADGFPDRKWSAHLADAPAV